MANVNVFDIFSQKQSLTEWKENSNLKNHFKINLKFLYYLFFNDSVV